MKIKIHKNAFSAHIKITYLKPYIVILNGEFDNHVIRD